MMISDNCGGGGGGEVVMGGRNSGRGRREHGHRVYLTSTVVVVT